MGAEEPTCSSRRQPQTVWKLTKFGFDGVGADATPDIAVEMIMSIDKVNLERKFALFSEHYKPKIVGQLNGQLVKLVKLKGPFVWHKHDLEDEMFLVVEGSFRMEFRDHNVDLFPGEFIIVPRGVEHRPVADDEVQVMLFEPASTLNTGDAVSEMTLRELETL